MWYYKLNLYVYIQCFSVEGLLLSYLIYMYM